MRIGLGCVALGTASGGSWRHDVRVVQAAIDGGVQVLDVADAYGQGASERIVGRAIRGRRDEVEVATKGGYLFRERSRVERTGRRMAKSLLDRAPSTRARAAAGSAGAGAAYRAHDFSPPHLRSALEASLRRLDTDHVDVYQLHGPPDARPELLEVLHDAVAAGKVRRVGVGSESVDAAAAWSAVSGLDVLQLPLGILDRASVVVAERAHRNGVEVWARGVFGGGVLAAAARAPGAAPDDPKAPLIRALLDLAGRSGVDVFALALGFVRSVPDVSTVLLGMSSQAHVTRNLELALGPPLPADVRAEVDRILDAADRPGRAS